MECGNWGSCEEKSGLRVSTGKILKDDSVELLFNKRYQEVEDDTVGAGFYSFFFTLSSLVRVEIQYIFRR